MLAPYLVLLPLLAGQAEPQRTIIDQAFTPARFFEQGFAPDIAIQYLGDDYAYPVYAIAVRRMCLTATPGCKRHRIARMVRSPNADTVERPRWAGQALVARVHKDGAKTPEAVRAVLDGAGLDWLEADVDACPTAMAVLPQAASLNWVAPEVTATAEPPMSGLYLHFDTVTVSFAGDYTRKATFSGRIDNGLPSGWAVAFARALEPCWKPASAPPPWRR